MTLEKIYCLSIILIIIIFNNKFLRKIWLINNNTIQSAVAFKTQEKIVINISKKVIKIIYSKRIKHRKKQVIIQAKIFKIKVLKIYKICQHLIKNNHNNNNNITTTFQ